MNHNKSIRSHSHSKDKKVRATKIPQILIASTVTRIPTSEMTPLKHFELVPRSFLHLQMFRNNKNNTSRKNDMWMQFVPKVVLDLRLLIGLSYFIRRLITSEKRGKNTLIIIFFHKCFKSLFLLKNH